MKAFFCVLLFSLLLGACAPASLTAVLPTAAPPTLTPPAAQPPAATETPVPTSAVEPATALPSHTPAQAATSLPPQDIKTLQDLGVPSASLTDPTGGFAFDYPAGWIVRDTPEADKKASYIYSITLRSAEITPGPKQQEGLPEGLTAVDIVVNHQEGPKTLVQAVNERRDAATTTQTGQPLQILTDEEWTLPGGLPAHRFIYNLGPAVLGTPGPDRLAVEVVTMVKGKMVLLAGQGDLTLATAVAASLREVE